MSAMDFGQDSNVLAQQSPPHSRASSARKRRVSKGGKEKGFNNISFDEINKMIDERVKQVNLHIVWPFRCFRL